MGSDWPVHIICMASCCVSVVSLTKQPCPGTAVMMLLLECGVKAFSNPSRVNSCPLCPIPVTACNVDTYVAVLGSMRLMMLQGENLTLLNFLRCSRLQQVLPLFCTSESAQPVPVWFVHNHRRRPHLQQRPHMIEARAWQWVMKN